jgi:probable F420-dependent oxidoreductase
VKIGVVYPQNELRGEPEAVRRIGLAAEELGYEHVLAYDDPFVLFAYLAGITQRIEFATGVLVLPQRQTVLVARQAADLDLLSGGRFRLGVGTGWNYVEYDSMGQDFHRRGERLGEQVRLLRRLWSEPLIDFTGTFDTIDKAALVPRPRRTIPIWFGGFADVAFRRAASLGDGFIFADYGTDVFESATRMQRHLIAAGRSDQPFGMDWNMLQVRAPNAVVDAALRWRDIGGTHLSIGTMGQGFTTLEQHLDHMRRVADAVRTAGL